MITPGKKAPAPFGSVTAPMMVVSATASGKFKPFRVELVAPLVLRLRGVRTLGRGRLVVLRPHQGSTATASTSTM